MERDIGLLSVWKCTPVSHFRVLLLVHAPSFPVLLFYRMSWEPQRQVNLRSGLHLDPMAAPTLVWPHQPLVRTKSSPASTTLPPSPHPPATLSLSSSAADVQLRFTTGEDFFFYLENVKRLHEL